MVIFGATGDLTKRLLAPALYNLARQGLLPEGFALIGVARAAGTAESWRAELLAAAEAGLAPAPIDPAVWARLADRITYVRGDLAKPALHAALGEALAQAQRDHGTGGNALFYLALADRLFAAAVEGLSRAKLTDEANAPDGAAGPWRRVVIEKPFGHDLASARALNASIGLTLKESQIFRIDHFLGKDAVQSLMAFRFENGLFEPIWNRDRIDHVQITAAETVGVEHRGDFYEATGALRDMVPNHALSLISLVAMEPPAGADAAAVRDRKAEVLAAIPAVSPAAAVRGQYGASESGDGGVKAYREEPGVAAMSNVETYVALAFTVHNRRWAGVPFYFRTGKHMSARATEIAVCFKPSPADAASAPGWLVLSIAPDEGISLEFQVKRPGVTPDLAPVAMAFRYDDWFPRQGSDGYETLLHAVMTGDQTLFMRADMVEEGWRIVQPVLDAWTAQAGDFPDYASGADGPAAAAALLAGDGGRAWRAVGQPAAGRCGA